MNRVRIDGHELVVEPVGLDKIWSFEREIRIPLAHVRGATVDPGAEAEPKGIRAPGLSLPGKHAGTFYRDGERTFWNTSASGSNLVIQLADEHFDRLVLTVDDPRALERAITAALP